ncbi:MAG: hypothetical protein QM604_01105, partial [Microbacterium sp.]
TQDDIDAGEITNTAVATGTDPSEETVTSNEDDAEVTAEQSPELTLVKTADVETVTAAGDTITYTFTVTNSGNVTVDTVAVSETAFSGSGTLSDVECDATSLASGESTDCTATYTVTQADIDAGEITNTAVATGTDPNAATVTSNEDDAVVTATESAALTLVKSADVATIDAVGDTITYTFTVTNSGNVTVDTVAIDETSFSGTGELSAITCAATTLAPEESTSCTATYTVTQDDIDAGEITNTAVATGTDPSDVTVTSNEDDAEVIADQSASLSLVKSADVETVDAVGDTVTYTFTVTNTGNVTVDDIAIGETAFSGSGTLSDIECDATTLAPAESTDCTATYTVTQDDIDAGEITNTAVATGTDPSEETVTSNEDDAVVTADQSPALTLVKTADVETVDEAGDTVTYTFTVTNSGNVTVSDIAISETAFSGTGTLSDVECDATSLASGESTDCTATYTVTQDDVDAGEITNTAVATGTDPNVATVTSNEDDAVVTAEQSPELSLVKSADVAAVTAAGDAVTYTFAVTNTGNVTVTGLAISETAFSGSGTLSDIECDATTLAPGESTDCTATYTVTQDDIDAGEITNTAVATGTDPSEGTVTSNESDAEITADQTTGLVLVKTASVATVDEAGDTITYTFTVTNVGNVTITGLAIAETAFSGTGTLSAIECVATTLAPAASTSCTATYTVTQDDVDAGEITNAAVATGTDPNAATVTSNEDDAEVTAEQSPELTLVKTADADTVDAAGDTITYTFTVTNTGNVTVSDIAIDETAFSGSGTLSDIECAASVVAPGESTDCTATYTVTQDDVDAGEITNAAVATGTDPNGETVTSEEDDAVVTASRTSALSLVKSADVSAVAAAGVVITYTFTVTNTGNVTITGIAISETAFSGSGTLSDIECTATTLAPSESTDCTATYTVTTADLSAGTITNTAVATGTDPGEATVTSNEDDAEVTAGSLAVTGADLAGTQIVLMAGLLFLLLGGAAVYIVRRRRV